MKKQHELFTVEIHGYSKTFKFSTVICEQLEMVFPALYIHNMADDYGDDDLIIFTGGRFPESDKEAREMLCSFPPLRDFYYAGGMYHSNLL